MLACMKQVYFVFCINFIVLLYFARPHKVLLKGFILFLKQESELEPFELHSCFENSMSLKQTQGKNNYTISKQTREKINCFTICSRQTHTYSQLQSIVRNIEKGRLFEPRARLFEPQEIIFPFLAEDKVMFNKVIFLFKQTFGSKEFLKK